MPQVFDKILPALPSVVHELPNGLKLLISEDFTHPVVAVQAWVETGSIHEQPWLGAGISHLLEHLVFKGTRKFSGHELNSRVQAAGGHWNAYTSYERTVYYIDGPAKSAGLFLETLADLVFHPTFPAAEFETEKDVIRREIAMYDDDPGSVIYQLLIATALKNHPRRHPIIGYLPQFNELSLDDVKHYHSTRYTPENIFFVIAGAVKAADVIALFEKLVEAQKTPRDVCSKVVPTEPPQFSQRIVSQEFATPNVKLEMAWRLPEFGHPDIPALDVLARLLGNGRSAHLYRIFHDELGLAHDISASISTPNNAPGMLTVSAEVEVENCAKLSELVQNEIVKLTKADLAQEIEKIKRQDFASRLKGLFSASGRARELAISWHLSKSIEASREYFVATQRVTEDGIARAIQAWIRPDALTIAQLVPAGSQASLVSKTKKSRAVSKTPEQKKSKKIETEIITLKNGVRLVVHADERFPLVFAEIALQAGLSSETAKTNGYSALLAECMLKGTARRSAKEIASTLENIGGSISSSSGNNTIQLSASCFSQDLPIAMDLLSDVLISPTFPEEFVELEAETQLAESLEEEQDPVSLAFLRAKKSLFGSSPYGFSQLGSKDSLSRASSKELKLFHSQLVVAENIVICLSGNVDKKSAKSLAEQYFSSVEKAAFSPTRANKITPGKSTQARLDKQQAALIVAVPGLSITSPDTMAMLVFQSWCSEMAGPLFSQIREKLGLAYFVSATQFLGLDTGFFAFFLGTSPNQLELAKEQLVEEIHRLGKQGMSLSEFENIKTSLLASDALKIQRPSSLAQNMALDTLFGLGANYCLEFESRINSLKINELNSIIKKYLSQPLTVSEVMPPSEAL